MHNDYFMALGGGDEIGASSYLLHVDGVRVLIDAGIRPNGRDPYPDFERLREIGRPDALLLTHAHADHVGGLGALWGVAEPEAAYCTAATRDLVKAVGGAGGRAGEGDAADNTALRRRHHRAVASLEQVEYGERQRLGRTDVVATPIRAGHVLGAASYVLDFPSMRVLITGDIALHDQRAVSGFHLRALPDGIDTLIIEATYAYQTEPDHTPIEEQHFALATRVAEVIDQGGRVLIPAFALGRAQEIAALFADFFAQGLLAPFPVLLDGLTREVCQVYDMHRHELLYRRRAPGSHAIYTQYVQPTSRSFRPTATALAEMPPQCLIASSGMLLPGSRSAQYAEWMQHNLRDAIFFSGYLDDESPGKQMLDLGEKHAAAAIGAYKLSAHARSRDLQRLIRETQPRQVILVHGNFALAPDASFIEFQIEMERGGVQIVHARNSCPIEL